MKPVVEDKPEHDYSFDLESLEYHPLSEKCVNILQGINANFAEDNYFRVLTSFYLCQCASNMRTTVLPETGSALPVNMYCLLLGPSGFGKTVSKNVFERELMGGFWKKFMKGTFPQIAEVSMTNEAHKTAATNQTEFEEEFQKAQLEFMSCGVYRPSYPIGTDAAFRQQRALCQIAGVGATSFICDEIGFNMSAASDLLDIHLETYDVGVIQEKLIKNTSDHKHLTFRSDLVPANLCAFGTAEALFDGASVEESFNRRMENGYSRRFLYAYATSKAEIDPDPETAYKKKLATYHSGQYDDLIEKFTAMADPVNYNRSIKLQEEQGIILQKYELWGKQRSKDFASYDTLPSYEVQHRYMRVLKLSGAYAFFDSESTISTKNLLAAIKVVEEASIDFYKMINRPKNYVRLSNFVVESREEVTHADIIAKLKFYPVAKARQEELFALAIAWGHRNNAIIKKEVRSGIDFFRGESLKETNLDELRCSYSPKMAHEYQNVECTWDELKALLQTDGMNFLNHHVTDGHRNNENVIQGCDFIVLDCDGEVEISQFAAYMTGFKFYLYTTKSHTNQVHRFRAIIPLKYRVNLNHEEYRTFLNSIMNAMPYNIKDDCGNQRSKKWACKNGSGGERDGELFDPVPYLPNTKGNEDRIKGDKALKHMDRLQKFFTQCWQSGYGRNKTMIRYALMLLDSGCSYADSVKKVNEFNQMQSDPMDKRELTDTVFKSMAEKCKKLGIPSS